MTYPNETSVSAGRGDLMHVRQEVGDRGIVLHIAGEVDLTTSGKLSAQLRTAAEMAVPPEPVIANLDHVEYLGCSALLALVRAHERCEWRGVSLRIVSSSRPVLRSIAATGLDDVLSVSTTLDDALAAA